MMLNVEQQAAVLAEEPRILCLAGAGTGKSRVLVSRIERLIQSGAEPKSILALTFTNVAAREMQSRFVTQGDIDEEERMNFCPEFHTFHSFCFSVMCEPAIYKHFKYTESPDIAEDEKLEELSKKACIQTGVKLSKKKLECDIGDLSEKDRYVREQYDAAFDRLMIKSNVISFSKLIHSIVELFKNHDKLVDKWLDQFKYILVDEMQDTDNLQFEFIQSFPNAELFVVGDALQNLYSFRGTTSEIIKSLSRNDLWKTYKLTTNYRCSYKICDYANKLSTSYADADYRVDMQSADKSDCEDVEISTNPTTLDDIRSLITRDGTSAILCRTNKEAAAWRDILYDAGISYHSNKLCDYRYHTLRSVVDAEYFTNWFSKEFLSSLKYDEYIRWKIQNSSMDIRDLSAEFLEKYVAPLRHDSTVVNVMKLMKALVNLLLDDGEMDTEERLMELFNLLQIDEELDDTTLGDYISYDAEDDKVCLDLTNILEALKNDKSVDDCCGLESVYIGTIHSAKGLEYDNVLIPGVGSKSFQLDDEDNLNCYYVAVTRAKQYLEIHYETDVRYEYEVSEFE